uniref:Uncharacterized protein n=1 Tax=Brassica oleracea TaxID=3712 RepID=A0A3P6ESG9_BRAOL|nr:unnamed protein product [Brassica oleracea]
MQFCPSGIWDSDHTKTPLGLEMLLINEQGIVIPPGRIDTYLPHLVPWFHIQTHQLLRV